MPACKSVYEPREDSTMLEKHVRKHANGQVLDMGTGSGIQAITATYNNNVKSVIALDIQEEVIEHCKKNIVNDKISFLISDLFEIFKKNKSLKNKRFDTIIFNPPYLPEDIKLKDLTLDGGKKGYEVIERFINNAGNYLKKDGIILIVFSSLTKKDKVEEFIRNNLFEFELLEKKVYFFEQLYVYKLKKSDISKKLDSNGIKNIRYFSKGKRGFIFTGTLKNKKIAVKIKNPKSDAVLRIENEIKFLKLLNKKKIGPKLLFSGNDFLAYEFADGVAFIDFLENKKNDKKIALRIIKSIFGQLFEMDKLKINKEEMSHPQKHIIISNKNRPVLLDFERAHHVKNPGNVTQFCDFLISKKIANMLKKGNIGINRVKMIKAAKKYKKNQNKVNFMNIIKELR
ncbi:methyltransferase [Candidatus Woesearchaeota archaeon]|nr:methyltransferase [Candidatus Woesearchaeota archaeon]